MSACGAATAAFRSFKPNARWYAEYRLANNGTPHPAEHEVIRERPHAWWQSFLAAERPERSVILAERAFGRGRAGEVQVRGGGPGVSLGTEEA